MNAEKNVGSSFDRMLEGAFGYLLALAWLMFGALVLVLNEERWYALLYDDAFFYIKTASMLAQGHGFTFDGVNPTNGFHPLYLLLLAGLSWIIPLSGVKGIVAVVALDFLLWSVFVLQLRRFLAALGWSRFQQVLVLLTALPLTAINDFGLESRLLLPVLFAALARLAKGRRDLLTGLLLAGVLLTRIDSVVLIVLTLAIILFESRRANVGDAGSILLNFGGPVVLAACGYLAINLLLFGHPTSISSWLKFGWPGTLATGWFAQTSPGFKLRMLVCSIGAGAFLFAMGYRVRNGTEPLSRGLLLLGGLNLFTILYFSILLLFARSGIYGWYFALPMTTLSLTVAWFVGPCKRGGGTGLKIALLAGCLIAAGADLVRRLRLPDPELPAMASLLRRHTPPDARILMVDVSGKMGYASERAIVNGDGLINGWEYQEMLRTGKLLDYLKKHRIDWLLWHWFYDQEKPQILIPLWHGPSEWRVLTFVQPVKPALRAGRFALFALASATCRVD